MNKCYLSVDLEDFSYNLQRSLGLKNPVSRPHAIDLSIERILKILKDSPGSDNITFFSTGQLARDNEKIIRYLADAGHEIACHNYYHDNVNTSNREDFSMALDDAIDIISQSSGKPVYGFRAPNFSIDLSDKWAYEEISKRFLYDSSVVSSTRNSCERATDIMTFGDNHLMEFPVFSYKLMPKVNVRVIGGTYLKILPLKVILWLMRKAVNEGFVPLIYIHPYEVLYDNEFWVSNNDMSDVSLKKRIYWQVRQNQWLKFGNKSLIRKLYKILEVFPNQGTMVSNLKK